MKTLLLLFILIIPLLASEADASYSVYLKNGSVIKGASHYEKSNGEIRFYFEGGMIGISEADILKIEITGEPGRDFRAPEELSKEESTPSKPEAASAGRTQEVSALEAQPTEKENEIAQREAELKEIEEELRITRVRVQNLYSRSLEFKIVKNTIKKPDGTEETIEEKVPVITPEEGIMLQQNMFKRRRLEGEEKRLQGEIKQLREGTLR